MPSASNIRRYAEIVRERSILRKLVCASDEIATNAFNPQGKAVDKILDEAEQKIFNIGEEGSRMKQGFQGMDALVVELLDRVTEMAENPNDITGVRTGFYEFDKMTSGLQPGDMIVLAARPSMGKTSLAINIAEHVALERRPAGGGVLDGNGRRAAGGAYRGLHRPHRPGPPAHRQAQRRRVAAPDRSHREAAHRVAAHRRNAGPHRPANCAPTRAALHASTGSLGLIVVDYLQLMSVSTSTWATRTAPPPWAKSRAA